MRSPNSSPIKIPFNIREIPINDNIPRMSINGLRRPNELLQWSLSDPKTGCNKIPKTGLSKNTSE